MGLTIVAKLIRCHGMPQITGRRQFLQTAAALVGGVPKFQLHAASPHTQSGPETAPKSVIFTDLRYIRAGSLGWYTSSGKRMNVTDPPEPPVDVYPSGAPDGPRVGMIPRGVRLVAQRATKSQPFAAGQGPLGEAPSGVLFYPKVIFDNGVYRCWQIVAQYPEGHDRATTLPSPVVEVRCRESKDGAEWKEISRVRLDIHGQTSFDTGVFFIDKKARPEERYKAVYQAVPPKQQMPALWNRFYGGLHARYRDGRVTSTNAGCLYGLTSPDGVRWRALPEPLMLHWSDTDTDVSYDPYLDKYAMYTRLWPRDRRGVGRAESDDFQHWGPIQQVMWPSLEDALSDDVYLNGKTEYPGVPGCHLMFPMIYHRSTETADVHLASSVDGVCWDRVPGGPILSPGAPGEWDSEFITSGKDLVPLGNDKIGFVYQGTRYPHKYPRWKGILEATRQAWAWWPKGRLCAVTAAEEGEFCTLPLTPAGRELRINARTRLGGFVKVGLLDCTGRTTAECDPIQGDSLNHVVRWKGQSAIGPLKKKQVTIHFQLRAAEIFGLEWV